MPLCSIPLNVTASELASFRRCFPIGSSLADWKLATKQVSHTMIAIHVLAGPVITTDGSVEEAMFTLLLIPSKVMTTYSLPEFRKALHDIGAGSRLRLKPRTGESYDAIMPNECDNVLEVARWIRNTMLKLDEETKTDVSYYAQEFFNKREEDRSTAHKWVGEGGGNPVLTMFCAGFPLLVRTGKMKPPTIEELRSDETKAKVKEFAGADSPFIQTLHKLSIHERLREMGIKEDD